MRQSEMDLLLAKGEYEVRSYFLCGLSARANNVNGTTMYLTNKRLVLEFMNNNEVSRREIPVDKITFVKSHYYEEEEDPTFAQNCVKQGTSLTIVGVLLSIFGLVGTLGVFDIFSLFGLTMPLLNLIFVGIALGFIAGGIAKFVKAKKFRPRVGKRLELLIGTDLDFEKGVSFTTDTTGKLRANMRTYRGTAANSLVGRVQLTPTREAKKMTNELGALIIDIKAGLYDEDPEVKAAREEKEREEKRQKRIEEQRKKRELEAQLALEEEKRKSRQTTTEVSKKDLKEKKRRVVDNSYYDENIKKDREARMAKYGAPLDIDVDTLEDPAIPSAMTMQLKKSKMNVPQKKKNINNDLIDDEYEAIIKSLNIN